MEMALLHCLIFLLIKHEINFYNVMPKYIGGYTGAGKLVPQHFRVSSLGPCEPKCFPSGHAFLPQ